MLLLVLLIRSSPTRAGGGGWQVNINECSPFSPAFEGSICLKLYSVQLKDEAWRGFHLYNVLKCSSILRTFAGTSYWMYFKNKLEFYYKVNIFRGKVLKSVSKLSLSLSTAITQSNLLRVAKPHLFFYLIYPEYG